MVIHLTLLLWKMFNLDSQISLFLYEKDVK